MFIVDDLPRPNRLEYLVNAHLHRPLRPESQRLPDAVEVDPVVAAIYVLFEKLQLCLWYDLVDQPPDVPERKVLTVRTYIENRIGDRRARRFKGHINGTGSVIHMKERPPLIAAEDCNHPLNLRLRCQQIHDQIEARAARQSVNGAESQDDRLEPIALHALQHPLACHLTAGIKGHRPQRRMLVEIQVTGAIY